MYYIPLLSIAILYLVILLKLKSRKTPGAQSDNSRKNRATRERNVLKMSIAIVSTFAICWLPFSSSELGYRFSTDKNLVSSCGYHLFRDISLFLAVSYCAINPCICLFSVEIIVKGLRIFSVAHLLVPGLLQSNLPSNSPLNTRKERYP